MLEDDEFHEFDPYDQLIKISMLLNELTTQHNLLVEDYFKTQKRLKMLENQLIDLQMQIILGD